MRLVLALALCCGGQAHGWEVFEARCLERFEHVFASDLRGLTLTDTFDGMEEWHGAGVTLRRAVTGGPSEAFCAIVGPVDEDALAAWAKAAVAEGRYFDVSPDAEYAPQVFQSTEWREPRIEVVIVRAGEPMVMVIETDLES